MEVELMKPSTLDQTEMMKAMMQLDMLPQLSLPHANASESLEIKFSSVNNCFVDRTSATTPFFHNPFLTSTTLTNPPSSMPFRSSPFQEPTNTNQKHFAALSHQTMGSNFPQAHKNMLIWPAERDSIHERDAIGPMREMIFRMAVMQPIQIDPESVKPVKRKNVKISRDPQSVAARHRRERISERIRILQRLVPGGTKMDTACMLDEAIHYVKFLKKELRSLEQAGVNRSFDGDGGIPKRAMLLPDANCLSLPLVKGLPGYSNGGLYSNA